MADNTVPVYLFLGFLEAGKTQFIQTTLEDENFGAGDNILLLVCEEGVEEYKLDGLKNCTITMKTIDDISQFNKANLAKMAYDCKADCVVLEYNGMWSLNDLFVGLPDNWAVFQAITIVDATTAVMYNNAMRQLMYEKLSTCNVVVFNRFEGNATKEELHKLVRGSSRGANIYYETNDGDMELDDIEDPLPFDMNADIIEIKDIDFAVWFSDIMENTKNYNGKTIRCKMLITKQPRFPKDVFAVGRYMMTCCAADVQFVWIAANYKAGFKPRDPHWAYVTGKISVGHDRYRNIDYPIMDIVSLEDAPPPAEEVASF
ncbi:MAG: GTPase [Ruminiclostridium sp.]|nr:GTPase [Ruminiclostridium sp.]